MSEPLWFSEPERDRLTIRETRALTKKNVAEGEDATKR